MGEAAVATDRWGETRRLACPVVEDSVVVQIDFFGIRVLGGSDPAHVGVVARPGACSGSDRCGATRPGLVDPLDSDTLARVGCPLRVMDSTGRALDAL